MLQFGLNLTIKRTMKIRSSNSKTHNGLLGSFSVRTDDFQLKKIK